MIRSVSSFLFLSSNNNILHHSSLVTAAHILRFSSSRSTLSMSTPGTALSSVTPTGAFNRVPSIYRNSISPGSTFPPASGRYHLYISYACPWANRCLVMLRLKGLEKHIGLSVVHPTWQLTRPGTDEHSGWVFRAPHDPSLVPLSGYGSIPCDGCIPDPLYGLQSVRQLYEMSDDTAGKYTVPVLWDTEAKCIVNNESSEILRILNSAFNELEGVCEADFYPMELRAEIDAVNDWVYPDINNGVYRCGFARSQEAYEEAAHKLFAAIDRVEDILTTQSYIASKDRLTEADIRLFMTLIRFDEVYVMYFKCSRRALREYPFITRYMQRMMDVSEIASSINMDHIKRHYFTSHPALNAYSVIPISSGTIEGFTSGDKESKKQRKNE